MNVMWSLVVGHANWIHGDDILVVNVWQSGEIVAPPVEPDDNWVVFGLIIVVWKIHSIFSEHGLIHSGVMDRHIEQSCFTGSHIRLGVATSSITGGSCGICKCYGR